jgi:hypothetical protein
MRTLLLLVLLAGMLGCSGDRDKGINKDKDRPKVEEKK